MRNIYVRLDPETIERLRRLADAELRDTKAQAAILIIEGLRRAERSRAGGRKSERPAP